MGQQMEQNAAVDLAVLPGNFMFFITIFFKKRHIPMRHIPTVINNVLFVKPSAHAQSNAGHLTTDVIWTLFLLVTSLCTGRFSLFKQ